MQNHVIIATELGWDKQPEKIKFDASKYTREEAESQFVKIQRPCIRNDRWVLGTAYEYNGNVYHHYYYMGCIDD